jgi:HIT zinc finger
MLSSLQNIVDHNQKSQETRLEALATPCRFCNQRLAKYVCPRCTQGYCSVDCYRSRNHEECSEGFYKQQVKEAVGGIKGTDEEREKMLETLKKYNFTAPEEGGALEFVGEASAMGGSFEDFDEVEDDLEGLELEEVDERDDEDEDEEDEETLRRRKDLETRMAGLNIEEAGFDEIWERLDPREREEFVRLAQELEKEENKGLTV